MIAAPATANVSSSDMANDLIAQHYVKTVKENRSAYGSYVDNALAFNPNKETKSMYNVVYDTQNDDYFPWGKPGGGAPMMDTDGRLRTKIHGTMRWNLNGENIEEKRQKKAAAISNVSPRHNVMIYKKNFLPPSLVPRTHPLDTRTKTTYNHTFRDFRDPYAPPEPSGRAPPSGGDTDTHPHIDPGFYGIFNSNSGNQLQQQEYQPPQHQHQHQHHSQEYVPLPQPSPPPIQSQQQLFQPVPSPRFHAMPQSYQPSPFQMPQSALPSINSSSSYQHPMFPPLNSMPQQQQQQQQLSAILPFSAPVRQQPPPPPPPQQMNSPRNIPIMRQQPVYQEKLQPQIINRDNTTNNINNNINSSRQPTILLSSDLERQATLRSFERAPNRPPLRKSDSELRRESGKLQSDSFDNGKPSNPYWFGRAGPIDGVSPKYNRSMTEVRRQEILASARQPTQQQMQPPPQQHGQFDSFSSNNFNSNSFVRQDTQRSIF